MNENGNKKREWVKTAAIIFLSIMLVLTFFSNTIMNYSLPEVATQYVQPGTVTAKIRGGGTVESGDPYEVKVTETRKVSSVAVRVGDEVQKGDILFYLEDAESEELKAAQERLEEAQEALEDARENYQLALLTEALKESDIRDVSGGVSVSAYRRKITDLWNTIFAAEDEIEPLQKKEAELEAAINAYKTQESYESSLDTGASLRLPAAEKAKENALEALRAMETALDAATTHYNAIVDSVSAGDADKKAAEDALKKAKENHTNAVNAYNTAVTNYNNAVQEKNNRDASPIHANLNNGIAAFELELATVKKDLEAATAKKTEAQNELESLGVTIGTAKNFDDMLDAIAKAQKAVDKAQEEVDELTAKSIGATITADIAGTVTAINVTAGNNTSAAMPVAVLQPEGKGYTMSFSVTNEQAKRLSVGDRAELVNSWWYDDVEVVLESIKPDPQEPGKKKRLTFTVTGSVTAGQTLNVSVGQKSANYDLIVPNSAIREDSNGKFILIVESRQTPLGTRYTAARVDVQVLASDDNQSAISAGLSGYEYVITTSTKPVEAGKQVRLTDNN
ncbi:MAG: biotin/lipoyl-binding protein [Acetatifactor sp.]|nr:biotin/lipoyl-binding protein [Acetatifactor sp.]